MADLAVNEAEVKTQTDYKMTIQKSNTERETLEAFYSNLAKR